MFNLSKKEQSLMFVSPTSGQVVPITEVKDDVFSQGILGVGYAVKPSVNDFFAPVDGVIEAIFPTKHAMTFKTKNGIEMLLHLGIDTVDLKGAPFKILVNAGQNVQAGEMLGSMDRKQIKLAGKDDTILIIFTNKDKIATFPTSPVQAIGHGDSFGKVVLK